MTRMNIYTRPIDSEVWMWARWKAEQDRISLSRLISDALRRYRDEWETEAIKNEEER